MCSSPVGNWAAVLIIDFVHQQLSLYLYLKKNVLKIEFLCNATRLWSYDKRPLLWKLAALYLLIPEHDRLNFLVTKGAKGSQIWANIVIFGFPTHWNLTQVTYSEHAGIRNLPIVSLRNLTSATLPMHADSALHSFCKHLMKHSRYVIRRTTDVLLHVTDLKSGFHQVKWWRESA